MGVFRLKKGVVIEGKANGHAEGPPNIEQQLEV